MQVSVIIPCYNSETSIVQALASVYSQSQAVHEVIVIDDGSIDQTCQRILEFKEQNNIINLTLIKQSNSGPASARNQGISVAKGDWIAFLDSDDSWLPKKIETQQQYISQNPDLILIGEALVKNSDNQALIPVSFKKLLFKNYFITSSVIVKKDILPDCPFDYYKKYSEDYKLWLDICYNYPCAILNLSLVNYTREHEKKKNKSLSSRLWKMEKGELDNYYYCYHKKYINIFLWITISLFSLTKFLRRLVLNSYR